MSTRWPNGINAVMIYAALMLTAAAPVPDADVKVGPTEPLTTMMPMPDAADSPYWQMVIEQKLIIRVPASRSRLTNFKASPDAATRETRAPIVWKEKKAPKCVSMYNIMGMQAVQRDSIDIITRQNQRLRAQLNRGCRALDFYAGFYMEGNKDGRLCEDRDEIHARTGAKCEIDKFRLLIAVPRDDE